MEKENWETAVVAAQKVDHQLIRKLTDATNARLVLLKTRQGVGHAFLHLPIHASRQ